MVELGSNAAREVSAEPNQGPQQIFVECAGFQTDTPPVKHYIWFPSYPRIKRSLDKECRKG
jgi:hypothetical protein